MRIIFFLFFISISFCGLSQTSFSNEFSLLTDNDLYTSTYRDRYYTNGLFLTFRTVSNLKNEKLAKKIHSFQIGHMMFTPIKATLPFASTHDRPFAGYFYGEYGQSRFFTSQNVLITNLQLGVIGPNAKGQELQNFMHQIYNYPEAKGWKHQIENAFAINLNTTFIKHFKKASTTNFDLNSYNELKAGTIFTSISTGLYTRFGLKKLQKTSNSVSFNSNLNNQANQSFSESFFFLKPMLNYILYDATIQGSFLNKTSPVTYDVKPFNFSLELGYKYYYKRFLYGYTFHFHTKKLKSSRASKSNTYGSIYIGYYFN
jgi:hypothetical protein